MESLKKYRIAIQRKIKSTPVEYRNITILTDERIDQLHARLEKYLQKEVKKLIKGYMKSVSDQANKVKPKQKYSFKGLSPGGLIDIKDILKFSTRQLSYKYLLKQGVNQEDAYLFSKNNKILDEDFY